MNPYHIKELYYYPMGFCDHSAFLSHCVVVPVSSFGRVQVVGSRGPRIRPWSGRRRVPHVQLKSEMLRLRGAEVESRVSRIYK